MSITPVQEKVQELQNLHDKLVEINKIILRKQVDKTPVTIQGFMFEETLNDMKEILCSVK